MAKPKARAEKTGGRPRIGEARRVQLNARVDVKTIVVLKREARRRDTSAGLLVDEAVALAFGRAT